MPTAKRQLVLLLMTMIVAFAAIGGIWVMTKRSPTYVMQMMAIPSYFRLGSLWSQLRDAAPTVGIAIVNPEDGPGTAVNEPYRIQVQQSQARGITILGYVATDHGKRDAQEVRGEIDEYYSWYHVDGIFFDEASTDCALLSYYKDLREYVKMQEREAVIVLNPGAMTNECYMDAANIIVTFENTYQAYTTNYQVAKWNRKYKADRFWHLIYGASTPADMENAVNLSKKRNVAWIYVTPAIMPNPWNVLPDSSYWGAELTTLA